MSLQEESLSSEFFLNYGLLKLLFNSALHTKKGSDSNLHPSSAKALLLCIISGSIEQFIVLRCN